MKEKLHKYLLANVEARERRFRAIHLTNFLIENYGYKMPIVDVKRLAEFGQDFDSADRQWRLLLSENKDLQGKDYMDKKHYEQSYELKLGYEVGYFENKKELGRIVERDGKVVYEICK